MSNVAIVGLGYVGLPLAVQAAEKGYQVLGVDLNTKLIETISAGKSPFANDERFAKALARMTPENFAVSTSFDGLREVKTVVICVPTPTEDNVPDLRFVLDAARAIAGELQKGQLVVLESTVNPGVTRDDVLPILEEVSGLKCGEDFYLAHCPERIDPGNPKFYVGNLNRVVGGITPECTKRAQDFYTSVVDAQVIPLGSTEEAEFVKSWENSHRNVMIALANEAAVICDALDMNIDNVLLGLQSKIDQLGLRLARPGIGPGGHCIPEDIHYVIRKARQSGVDTHFLESAAELNDKMPRYAVQQLQQLLAKQGLKLRQSRIALLGLAYKENIEDARRSPAIDVAQLLVQRADSIIVQDPYVDTNRVSIRGAQYADEIDEALEGADAIFLATAHTTYIEQLTPELLKKHNIAAVYDGRNCLDGEAIKAAGIAYHGMGRS